MKSSIIFTILISLFVTKLHAAPYQNLMKSADFLEKTKVALKPKGSSYLEIISKLKAVHDINGDEELKAKSLIELYQLVNKYITDHPESKRNPGMRALLTSVNTTMTGASADPYDAESNRFYDEKRAKLELIKINPTETKVVNENGREFTIKLGESLTADEKELALKSITYASKKINDISFPEGFNNKVVIGVGKDVTTQAFSGNDHNTIMLGKNFFSSNPMMEGTEGNMAGGLGDKVKGERGVADVIGERGTFKEGDLALRGEATVVHELAHLIHQVVNPTDFWSRKFKSGPTEGWLEVSSQVSHYAMKNELEFVAEAITKSLYDGGRLPEEVNRALGASLGGDLTLHCRR